MMNTEFSFTPLKFHWVAINPRPVGVVYFIGGAFFGSFPNIFYRYLLREIYESGYTIIAIPYRFTFRHWTVSIEMLRDLEDLRQAIYREAIHRGYTANLDLYLEDPTAKSPHYFWLGHSLGCKYIELLEILTEIDPSNIQQRLDRCTDRGQYKTVLDSLQGITLEEVSLKNQPSVFLAPVIAGIQNAIPIPFLAKLLQAIGLDVEPNVEETKCLISNSRLFNLLNIIAFAKDIRARDTVEFFKKDAKERNHVNRIITMPDRAHLAPLGWRNGDGEIAEKVRYSIEELRTRLVVIYPEIEEKEQEFIDSAGR